MHLIVWGFPLDNQAFIRATVQIDGFSCLVFETGTTWDFFISSTGQGCGSFPKNDTRLNLEEKMKKYLQVLTSLIKPQIWLFHVVVLLTTAKKWTKVKNARAGRAKLLFFPTKYANL